MSKDKNLIAILLAILAAALYAISTPVSKVILQTVAPTMVAAFLYLGAGIGMGAMMLVRSGRHRTTEALTFSRGSLLVLGATICWGLENSCTRQIADRDPMEIVTVKGFGSGLGALMIAVCVGSEFPTLRHIAIILLLGYVAYGLSIYFYTYAQRTIGAAKTSTYYALAPFIGALLSILLLGEPVTMIFIIASILMAAGCWIAAK